MSLTRRSFVWAVVALLGIVVAAALTWSVTKLAAQRIGLSSEPLSVIRGLAPATGRPKSAASQGDGEPPKATVGRNGSVASPPPPATSTLPSITATPPSITATPPPVTASAPPVTATAPAATATPAPSAGPAQNAPRASAGGSGSLNGGDHPDDSSGGPRLGSNGGHVGRDD
jgi:cytoskeletal protein RodZ